MKQDEEKWSVTANGKAISNGTTIRNKYGRVSLRIVTKSKDQESEDEAQKKNIATGWLDIYEFVKTTKHV